MRAPPPAPTSGVARADGLVERWRRGMSGLALGSRSAWLAVAVLLPLACIFHARSAFAAGEGAAADAELALCEFADISIADGPPACAAPENAVAATPEPAPSDAAGRAAPMCDNGAASIAAVPEVPEVDRGRIEPGRCDIERLLALLRSDDRARSAAVIAGGGENREPQPVPLRNERGDAACTGGVHWPVAAAPALMTFGAPPGLGWQRGHSLRIERPPSQP